MSFEIGKKHTSQNSVWPTRDEPSYYQFNSVYLELSQEYLTYERSTYSLLEWLGDVGGLFDGLKIVAYFILWPFSAFAMKAELMTSLFKQSKDGKNRNSRSELQHIPKLSCLRVYLCKCRSPYRKWLNRA